MIPDRQLASVWSWSGDSGRVVGYLPRSDRERDARHTDQTGRA